MAADDGSAEQELTRTPLHALHTELGAKMVPFAGYEMPVHYPAGIIQEHLHTRAAASLFDVSHMGQVRVSGPRAAAWLESVVPADLVDLPAGAMRYTMLTNESGGVRDDVIVGNAGEHLLVVVNAACKEEDVRYLRGRLTEGCVLEVSTDRALVALQGPRAAAVMSRLCPAASELGFMMLGRFELDGTECWMSRSGYTGEDGFEISLPAARAEALARRLLAEEEVAPAGLGARDSLRLECGLCLYGHELDEGTSPVEAGLRWTIAKARRAGGKREGGFPGADTILDQLAGGVSRRRVGVRPQGRALVRGGARLLDAAAGEAVGIVTSGGYGPSVGGPIAMAYVVEDHWKPGTRLSAEARGRLLPATVVELPFVAPHYQRSREQSSQSETGGQ